MADAVLPLREAGRRFGKPTYSAAWKFFRRAKFRLVRIGKRGIGVRESDILKYIEKNTEDPAIAASYHPDGKRDAA